MTKPNQTPTSPDAAQRAALLKASPQGQDVSDLQPPASLAQLQRLAGVTQVGVDHREQAAALFQRPYLADGHQRQTATSGPQLPRPQAAPNRAVPPGHRSVDPTDFRREPLTAGHQRPAAITEERRKVMDAFAVLPRLRVGR